MNEGSKEQHLFEIEIFVSKIKTLLIQDFWTYSPRV